MSALNKKGFRTLSPFGNVTTGMIYFVDNSNTNAADGGTGAAAPDWGTEPDKPFRTVDYTIGQCTANKGDIIYVMPGHAETISTTAALIPDVAGVTIMGLGNASARPIFSISTTGSHAHTIGITGAGTRMSNMIFRAADQTGSSGICIFVNAADVTIDGCLFDHSSTLTYFGNIIEVTAGIDRTQIYSNSFVNFGTTAQAQKAIDLRSTGSTQIGTQIIGNIFRGNWSRAVILGSSVSSFSSLNISSNIIDSSSTVAADIPIDIDSTQVTRNMGVISKNRITAGSSAAKAAGLQSGCCRLIDNTYMLSTGGLGNQGGIDT